MKGDIESLDKVYADKSHSLFHLNTQIEGLERALKDRKGQSSVKKNEQIEQD